MRNAASRYEIVVFVDPERGLPVDLAAYAVAVGQLCEPGMARLPFLADGLAGPDSCMGNQQKEKENS